MFPDVIMHSMDQLTEEERGRFDIYGCSKLLPEFSSMEKMIKEPIQSQALLADVVCVANAHDAA
jgi:hypothetical protein